MNERTLPKLPDQPRVLVIDDNAINCLVAGDFCELFGCKVTMGNSGAEAIELCAAGTFDVILMDVRMPTMSGTQAARAISRASGAASAPIVALTGDGELSEVDLTGTGIVSVLLKPITMNALFAVLRDVLASPAADEGVTIAAL